MIPTSLHSTSENWFWFCQRYAIVAFMQIRIVICIQAEVEHKYVILAQ